MNKKLRFGVLIFCFIVFITCASWLVLYVQGRTYDRTTQQLSRTGIIAAYTEPDNAELYVNEVLKDKTPAAVRFLEPGDYNITIRKQGYLPWHKRLQVQESKVTWVNPNPNKLTLLKQDTAPITVDTNVLEFTTLEKNTIAYAKANNLVIASGNNFANKNSYNAPEAINSLSSSPSNAILLLYGEQNTWYFNRTNNIFTDISLLVPLRAKVVFVSDSEALVLDADTLWKIDFPTKNKSKILTNVLDFGLLDDKLYALTKDETGASLFYSQWSQHTTTPNLEKLADNIPSSNTTQLYVTQQKEIFILTNGILYKLNKEVEKIASSVTQLFFDKAMTSLLFSVPGELVYYNFDEQKTKLISRSTQPFVSPLLRRDLNFAFVMHEDQLTAYELDDRDHQNSYALVAAKNPKKIAFISNEKTAVLANNTLQILTIQ